MRPLSAPSNAIVVPGLQPVGPTTVRRAKLASEARMANLAGYRSRCIGFSCLQCAARPRAIVSSVVVHESLAQRSSGLAVNHPQAGLTRALDAAENLRQIQVVMRLGAG